VIALLVVDKPEEEKQNSPSKGPPLWSWPRARRSRVDVSTNHRAKLMHPRHPLRSPVD